MSLRSVLWWVLHRIHPRHRYNVIHTSLRPGYYDPYIQLRCAIFNVVAEFFSATGNVNWNLDQDRLNARRAFRTATEFWEENKQIIKYGADTQEESDWMHEEVTCHLHDIIDYLDYMWYP